MKAFIDSSSLLKKYIDENGSDDFLNFITDVTEIIVAPICWLEIQSALDRRSIEKTLTLSQKNYIQKEIKTDFRYFLTVKWNQNLQDKGTEYIHKYHLKPLDSIQLSSAFLASTDVFVTSDKQLFNCAKKELKSAFLII